MQGPILARSQNGREAEIPTPGVASGDGGAGAPAPSQTARSAATGRRGMGRPWLWPLLLLAFTAAVGALLYARWRQAGFHWDVFLRSFGELAPGWVAASAALALATYYGRALRWAVMLRPVKPHPRIWNLFAATAVGFTAVVLLGRAGELVRPYLIASKEKVPVSSQVAAWALERIYDLLAVLIVFGLALAQVGPSHAGLGPGLQWALRVGGYVVGIVSALCLVILLVIRRFFGVARRRLLDGLAFLPARHFQRAEGVVGAFVEGLASTRQAGALARLAAYTGLEWGLITLGYICLFRASPWTAGFGLREVVIFMGFVSLGSILQIPGVGGGVQVVSVVVLVELLGVPLEVAAGIAIVIWSITFVVIVPIGLGLSFHYGINLRKIKRLDREVSL